jgi:hypothetical protein
MNKKNEKKKLITEYIAEEDCICMCEQGLFNCDVCGKLDECYAKAEIECNDDYNDSFAESIDYGGYKTEEDFWNELFE